MNLDTVRDKGIRNNVCDCIGTVYNPSQCPRGYTKHGAKIEWRHGHPYVLVTDSGWWKYQHAHDIECPQCQYEIEEFNNEQKRGA